MVYSSATLLIIEAMIFSSYSIKLNSYLVGYFPNDMERFQIVRNSIAADAAILGMVLTIFTDLIFGLSGSIVIFLFLNLVMTIWIFSKRNVMSQENIERVTKEKLS